ncbi:MAG: protease complex subunit PrcB family protein [Kosmotogaceae bacterium]|nr:protease complex subunit PrcB family protein [Kosmotogaceae bacterium]
MKKILIAVSVIVFSYSLLSAFSVNYTELVAPESFALEQSIGSKTKSVSFSVLSGRDSDTVSVIISGWLFDPGNNEQELEASIQLIGSGEYYERRIAMVREGMYYVIDPFLLSFESGYSLAVMELRIDYHGQLEVEVKELNFESVSLQTERRSDLGLLVGEVREQGFVETRTISGEAIVIIEAGEKPTGGYDIVIRSVHLIEDNTIEVIAELQLPGSGDFVTQAFTYPNKAIKIMDLEAGAYRLSVKLESLKDGELVETVLFNSCFSVE